VRKVKLHAGGGFYFLIAVELGAIVCRDSLEDRSVLPDQTDDPLVQLRCRPVGQLSNHGVPGFALYQGHNAIFVTFAHNRVDFPMALGAAGFNLGRALINHALPSQPAPGIVAIVALAPLFYCPAQVSIKASSFRQVGPDPTVYGFVAHAEVAMALEVPADLLWAVLLGQQALNAPVLLGRMLQPPPGPPTPPIGPALCLGKPVVPVVGAAVAAYLTTDGATVSAQSTGNGRGTKAFLPQGTYRYSFV
jgi:hypothetical protein